MTSEFLSNLELQHTLAGIGKTNSRMLYSRYNVRERSVGFIFAALLRKDISRLRGVSDIQFVDVCLNKRVSACVLCAIELHQSREVSLV